MMDLERLRNTLGHPDLKWLLDRITHQIELGRPLTGSLTLRKPKDEQRHIIAKLLGRPMRPTAAVTVHLPVLAQLLQRAEICSDLREAVEALRGPVVDRRQEARRLRISCLRY